MSVLIRGMDMPNDCSECFVKVRECDVIEPLKINERPRDCPLEEVLTPHGRLIDADVLEREMTNGIKAGNLEEGYEDYTNINNVDDCVDCVRYADTIIEAED